MSAKINSWSSCRVCQGRGKKSKGIRKKAKLRYQRELDEFERSSREGVVPVKPRGHLEVCSACKGSGLVFTALPPRPNELSVQNSYPHIAIIGGGIGGVALAVACLHRQIPFTLYERDSGFDVRSQGYGLTLQQASKAIESLGIFSLDMGVVSTRHVVHTADGKKIGEWGCRKWGRSEAKAPPKRTNVHIARQSLRFALLEQLGGCDAVRWGHQLVGLKECSTGGVELSFQAVAGSLGESGVRRAKADLVVGADGIRSSVRSLLVPEQATPLRYLDCMVILGICPLVDIVGVDAVESSALLDSATVFQAANGRERIYVMPYDSTSVMWQLSFPMLEAEVKALSAQGAQALKAEAVRCCRQWHSPIPQILTATQECLVSGYPVYDRAPLSPESLSQASRATLIGDAAHPMSPFKGQGANQALLDALALARAISGGCRSSMDWRDLDLRSVVLAPFELEMLQRSARKVKDSADAAEFLHSDVVLHEGDEPRGRCLERE